MRVAEGELLAEADQLEQFGGAALGAVDLVDPHGFCDLLADDITWVQRRIGVLEHHLDDLGQLLARRLPHVEPVDLDRA